MAGQTLVDLRYALRRVINLAVDIEENGKDEPTCDGANHVAYLVGKALHDLEIDYLPHVYMDPGQED